MRTKNTSGYLVMRPNALILVGILFIVAAALVVPFHSVRSGSRPASSSQTISPTAPVRVSQINSHPLSNSSLTLSIFQPLLHAPQSSTESINTYDGTDCTTPKTDFNLGDTVCAKATGVPTGLLFPWKVSWVDPAGFIRQTDSAIADDQATYTYTLPSASTSIINGETVDNRGTWRVNLTRSNGAIRQTARFTVHEVANPQADVFVQKFQRDANDQIHTGDNIAFIIVVGNAGPDTSLDVHLVDSVPAGGSLVSFTKNSGPDCTAAGPANDCTIASMANGDRAEFTAVYNVGSNPPGTYETSATASGTAPDPNTSNNTSTAEFVIQSGSGHSSCDLTCPSSITTNANTTEGGQRGAHVTFDDAVGTGTCGAISSSPASGSFFPVGTTIVTATSETGGGQCTFAVTVDDANGNVTISCPGNKDANADNNCEATVSLGNPTTTGDNVTISVSRSDGKPMYDCDANGDNCTRKTTDLPFPAGVTTVTWVATSHDAPGPYQSPADEEAHRTGNTSCQQTVTVNDVTPPVITATDQTVSADANCQAAVPDYTNSVTDNCACAASDNSQDCVGQHRITVTQNPAAGTMVGLGPHTIHLTANDGSSNNGGAGNTTQKDITLTVNDTTPPTITCPADILNVHTDPGICAATVNPGAASASDNCSAPTIVGVRSDAQPLNALYPKGTTTITWTATDAAGNHSSCVQTITVIDVEPPVISCQADIIVDFDPAVNGATVNYTAPVGTDNCPGATTVRTAGLASGAVFPVGTTTNTFRVTDAAGNFAECSFKVTVALTSIIGLDSASLSGNALLDSYDSTGGYPATKGSLANLLSNGTVSVAGSSKVFGNVRSTRVGVSVQGTSQVTGNATAGTTVTKGASAIIGGTITNNALAPVMTLPSVPACGPPYSPNSGISGTYSYNASTGDLNLSGINIATLANGTYCFHNVTLTNSGQLKVNGLVVIKLTGTFNAGGASTVNNTTLIPANLRILSSYSGSNGVIFSNGNSAYLLIYAPNTSVADTGSAPLFGTVVGKTVTLSNSGMIHYDTKLKTIWPDIWTLIFGP